MKSSCYLSNPPRGLQQWILRCFNIEVGSLPTKFLGVPLINKRLNKRDCQPLIARITSRIHSWTTLFLAFAGRLQLIKSVLQAIFSYWGSHFIKPSSTSLWAEWIKHNVIKTSSFWTICKPRNCSWILKKVLDLRDIARANISYHIGNGQHTSLWFDPWYNNSPICNNPLDPIISHSRLDCSTKVSSILNSTGWSLPSSNYHDMIVWRSNFNTSTPFNLQKRDDISWNGITSKSIKITNLWHSIRHTSPPVPWFSNVWHKLGVPRYSFLHWLIMHGRVNTLSRLKLFGMVTLDTCYFCINGVENAARLFLECPNTQMVFKLITSGRCTSMHTDWSSWRQFLTQANRDIHSIIQILIFQVVTYNIWKERNGRYHSNDIKPPIALARDCTHLIKCRLHSSNWFKSESAKHPNLLVWTENL
ncbi:hypothetical protein POM88_045131 [Heracleum sosnowskyi]|uniref:Reverse transcriptase zinc-binding domain-containing protein n=1 Tax=Heracleum sosnowskyi TaxID=360622 RepID=A0AAD8H6U7_9APIA|nr:hypothetical protein POM88_045131 [Heracleum sosnowskyi]